MKLEPFIRQCADLYPSLLSWATSYVGNVATAERIALWTVAQLWLGSKAPPRAIAFDLATARKTPPTDSVAKIDGLIVAGMVAGFTPEKIAGFLELTSAAVLQRVSQIRALHGQSR